jgi:hypothetical protein
MIPTSHARKILFRSLHARFIANIYGWLISAMTPRNTACLWLCEKGIQIFLDPRPFRTLCDAHFAAHFFSLNCFIPKQSLWLHRLISR